MKSRSNSKKTDKQMFEAQSCYNDETIVHWKRFFTFFTETELQIDRNLFKKMTKLKNPNNFF